MYQVFNMGIGMTVVVSAADVQKALKLTKGRVIGRIGKGSGMVRLEF
jgi:phosphoribosylaminoimidazole (AIR) synthetase